MITPRERIEPWKDFFCAALSGLLARPVVHRRRRLGQLGRRKSIIERAGLYANLANSEYTKRLNEAAEEMMKAQAEIHAEIQRHNPRGLGHV